MLLQQTTFENVVTKEEIAQDEQFLLLTQCFQIYSISMSTFRKIFHLIVEMFSKSSSADLLYTCGKLLIYIVEPFYMYIPIASLWFKDIIAETLQMFSNPDSIASRLVSVPHVTV